MKQYTLKEIEKLFDIPARKMAFLIRKEIVEPVIESGRLFVSEEEIKNFLGLPKDKKKKAHVSYLRTLGPGVVTGASDDDPSGVITYSYVGSTFGLSLSWLAIYLLPMMSAVQETVARIGIVTEKGLSGAIGKHYGRKILYPLVFLLVVANTINIGADIGAMVASFQLLVPINFYIGAIVLTLGMLMLEIFMPYHKYAKVLKWLTLSLAAYIITGFIIRPDWLDVLRSMSVPVIKLNTAYIAALVAVMGTTITPYLFFWQASEEVEEKRDRGVLSDHTRIATNREIKEMRKDTYIGMALANIVFLFIVITTAFVLYDNGITNIDSAQEVASALEPLAGSNASLLFTLGIFGVGLLAVPVLAGASAYAIAELFKWKEGLNRKYSQAKGFYGVIIASMLVGLSMNFLGINPIKALYLAAIVNGMIAPILMFFIFKIGRDKKIMGEFTNPRWVNIWGYIATALMSISAISLIIFSILGS
jgi:Mn2+/Fe2+ NRAMP family transporter